MPQVNANAGANATHGDQSAVMMKISLAYFNFALGLSIDETFKSFNVPKFYIITL